MSFQQGVSGLNATAKNLEIIGNNIANANTFGAKSSRAEFSDAYATALSGSGANNIGIGVNLSKVAQQFTQGNITATGSPMDLAINGAGFFQLTDGKSPTQYSRNGQFKVDREGFIVNNNLLRLMGYPADGNGIVQPGPAQPLQLPTAGISPSATTRIEVEMNLDSRTAITNPGAGVVPQIDFNDTSTYNNVTSITVYDAKGQNVAMTYYFQKTANDQWNIFATADGQPVNGTAAAPDPITAAPIDFLPDGSGAVNNVNALPVTLSGLLTNPNGAIIVTPLTFDLSLNGATQYGSGFGVTNLTQDGYEPGQLSSISIEADGIVLARYSNGQSTAAGQIELATFRNPQGLQALGGNVWGTTYSSGSPVTGTPSDGNLGVLQAGSLEESNIDLTGELVSMIVAQRIYQANAQTIKTQDQVLQTLVNLR